MTLRFNKRSERLEGTVGSSPAPRPSPLAEKAKSLTEEVLNSSLPRGVPPIFERVEAACFVRPKRVVARLLMFDGQLAEVVLWQWASGAWAYRWNCLAGGDVVWEDGRWRRTSTFRESC